MIHGVRRKRHCAVLLAALVFQFVFTVADQVFAGPFTPGNLVVVAIGDGKTLPQGDSPTPVFLREYTTAGSLVQTIPLPTSASGDNQLLTLTRNRAQGQLNLSSDGRYLSLVGVATQLPPPVNGNNPTGEVVVARIDLSGTVDTKTHFTGAFNNGYQVNGASAFGAASVDGSGFWIAGDDPTIGGVHYVPYGGSTTTQLATGEARDVVVHDGQVYISTRATFDLSQNGIRTVGTGLPTSGSQPETLLPGFPTSSVSLNNFSFLDVNGVETLYIANDPQGTVPSSGGGIQKWSFDGSQWNLNYTLSSGLASLEGNQGVLQITTTLEGGVPVLYGTTRRSGGGSTGNSLVRVVDTGSASAFTTLDTLDLNLGFRGIAFAPTVAVVPEPATWVTLAIGGVGLAAFARQARRKRCAGGID